MAKNKKKRKPKVSLDKKKVFILCAIIISLCVLFLFLTALYQIPVQEESSNINANELVIIKEKVLKKNLNQLKKIFRKQIILYKKIVNYKKKNLKFKVNY